MKRSQPVKVSRDLENVKIVVQCPCPGNQMNQNYARKSNRPALANIQGEASRKQFLTVDPVQKVRAKPTDILKNDERHRSRPQKAPSRQANSCSGTDSLRSAISPINTLQQTNKARSGVVGLHPKPKAIRSVSQGRIVSTNQGTQLMSNEVAGNDDVLLHPKPRAIRSVSQGRTSSTKQRTHQLMSAAKESDDVLVFPKTTTTTRKHQSRNSSRTRPSPLKTTQTTQTTQFPKRAELNSMSKVRLTRVTPTLSEEEKSLAEAQVRKSSSQTRPSPLRSIQITQTTQFSRDTELDSALTSMSKVRLTRYTPTLSEEEKSLADAQVSKSSSQTRPSLLKSTHFSMSTELDSVLTSMSKVRLTRDTSILTEEERPFVDAQRFFSEMESTGCSTIKTMPVDSPAITTSVPVRRSNSISEVLMDESSTRKRATKATLKRRSSIKKQIVFPLSYSPDYIKDIIAYCYRHKGNLLLKNVWVEARINNRARTNVVNWLIKISLFVVPDFESVYYMAVRLFDCSIIKLKLTKGQYQLAAIVAFWISLKYLNNSVELKVSKMFSLCNGKYSKEEILTMERNILKTMDFCLNVSDPLDFLNHYLKGANLEDDELIRYGAEFVLECMSLSRAYPLMEPPFVAAIALYMAYRVLRNAKQVDIHIFMWYSESEIEDYVKNVVNDCVKKAVAEKYESVYKYLAVEKLGVAKRFF